ncbi:hypothetical protein ACKI1I_26270 [Streptomyces turgidiscabies]|uniref:hypothetical protein n=1 Tax=Streptomyces TaxID=1883 RepID=UPI00076E8562|nr:MULTISPECIES: hypothetical protein [Streptomyces]MDX3494174.1 hypothetical protein [Streptomyces turgidiscabies]GAQ68453.1 hypothetical protein T45_00164 [Streptomyces turgidiscabies]
MGTLVEFVLLGIGACGTQVLARAAIRRLADSRRAVLAASGTVGFPCRVSWEAGTGRKAFVYGKVVASAGADGEMAFSRRWKKPVKLPRSQWVHRDASWRAGLVNLRYAAPGRGDVRILLAERDADTLEGLLRGAG